MPRVSIRAAAMSVAALMLSAAAIAIPPAAAQSSPESSPPLASPRSIGLTGQVRDDGRRLFSTRTLGILAAGGALAGLSTRIEEPDQAARRVERWISEGGSDFGNAYGQATTLGSGALGLIAAGRLFKDDRVGDAGSDLARALVYAGLVTVPLKMAVARTRPNGERYSFPSGHSAAAFAAAPVLASHFGGRVGTLAYLAAVTTAMGRVEDRKHYVSDVVFGAALGLSVGLAVSDDAGSRRMPSLTVSTRGLGLTMRF